MDFFEAVMAWNNMTVTTAMTLNCLWHMGRHPTWSHPMRALELQDIYDSWEFIMNLRPLEAQWRPAGHVPGMDKWMAKGCPN